MNFCNSTLACLFGLLFVLDVFHVSNLLAVESDEVLTSKIQGVWASTFDPSNTIETAASQLHLYGLEVFNRNGQGESIVYSGNYCHRVVAYSAFRWYVRAGVLVTVQPDKKLVHDTIMQVTKRDLVLRSVEHGLILRRTRRRDCGTQ